MIDETTENLGFQLPHQSNSLEDDVLRLRDAIQSIDGALKTIQDRLATKGVAGGYASLDGAGKMLAEQLPGHQHQMVDLSDLAAWYATNVTDPLALRELLANKGAPNGYAPLDAQGRVPMAHVPEALVGSVVYVGGWNATTNTPAIPPATSENKGRYYIVTVGGTTDIDGIADWAQGDWIISNGVTWDRIANSEVFDATAIQTGVFDEARIPALPISKVTDLGTQLAGKQASLGFTPVQQGGGAGQGANKIHIGWGASGLKAQIDALDYGTLWSSYNFNPGAYMPLGGGTFSGNFTIQNTAPQINFYDVDWGWRYIHCNGGLIGFLNNGSGWACYSDNDGNFVASGNVGAYSDRKHKKQIRKIKGGLALVESLRGVRYVDKRTGADRIGVIAQEVQKHLPEVVGKGVDGLHVDYGNLVAPLIEAVKELSGRVRKLEAR